jgi:hypothetical protein
MMNMRAPHEEIQIGDGLGHDEEHEDARQNKSHQESKQRKPRQLVRGFPPPMNFRVRSDIQAHDFGRLARSCCCQFLNLTGRFVKQKTHALPAG